MKIGPYLTAATVALALTATACSSSKPASAPAGNATTSSAGTTSSGAGTIHIGFANMDTGTTSFPAVLQAAKAGVAYLNKTQGGLAGKQIELISCDMKNDDQSAQKCGQQFANDASIPFVMLSATINGGPFYAALAAAHKPVLGAIGVVPADYSPQSVYFYYPGSNYYQTLGLYLKSLNLHSFAMIYESNPSSAHGQTVISKVLTDAGSTVKATGIPPAASDVTAAVANAGINSADATVLVTNGSCNQIIAAMHSLNLKPKHTVAVATCATPKEIASAASNYEGWDYYNTFKVAGSGSGGGADVTTFLSDWSTYGPGGTPGTWAELGWGLVLTSAKVFKGASTITSASADTAIKGYHGSVVMGPDAVSCPGPAPYISTCAQGADIYKITNGKLMSIPF